MKPIGNSIITVSTGSRLHFGLTRIRPCAGIRNSESDSSKYGGVGVMIDDPSTVVQIQAADQFSTSGSIRLPAFAKGWAENRKMDCHQLPCHISVIHQSFPHSGLGSGTQLAHAIAQAMELFFLPPSAEVAERNDLDLKKAARVASQLQRGNRSMIGSYGFARGGMIVDGPPHPQPGEVAELVCAQALPHDWRVVIVCHRHVVKKFGLAEKQAFRDLVNSESELPKQKRLQRELEQMIDSEIIPSAQSANFKTFCDSIHQYGKLSGEFYTKVQGGIYNGPVIASVVKDVLQMGGRGVGQSSWGPVVYSWAPNEPSAIKLRTRLASHFGEQAKVWISKVRNVPASISHSCDLHESSK